MIKLSPERIIACLFNLIMAGFFCYSFFFPKETDYWLARNGFLILILEFLSIIMVAAIIKQLNKESGLNSSGNMLAGIILILFMAIVFTWSFGAWWLLAYFLINLSVKTIYIYFQKDAIEEGKIISYSAVAFMISAFLALPISILAIFFPGQNQVYQQFFKEEYSDQSGAIIDNPFMILAWGGIYFLMLAAISIIDINLLNKNNQSKRR